MTGDVVTMAHGGGGTRMRDLLEGLVFPLLGEEILAASEDAARLEFPGRGMAFTTDSFVVRPLFFSGGDIGKLAVCGTVNDLAMVGARPLYMTLGLIIEEGLPFETLERVLRSVGEWAGKAGVKVVAGDTKVVERGQADGLYVNTSGVGILPEGGAISISGARPGDVLLVNGYVADHGIAVLHDRDEYGFEIELESDCAPLNGLVDAMTSVGEVHSLRDPTRGGLAAAAQEMASASGCELELAEGEIPVRESVRAACEMLGLDPMCVANEGKLLASIAPGDAADVLEAMKAHELGGGAARIGTVVEGKAGRVVAVAGTGGRHLVRVPSGELLPRIC